MQVGFIMFVGRRFDVIHGVTNRPPIFDAAENFSDLWVFIETKKSVEKIPYWKLQFYIFDLRRKIQKTFDLKISI